MNSKNSHFIFIFTLATFALFSACSPNGFQTQTGQNQSSSLAGPMPNPADPIFQDPAQYTPLKWEKTIKNGAKWSMMIYEILLAKEPTLIKEQVTDIATFCPRYNSLPALQRMNFWGQLVSAISFYESGWNPLSRFIEVDMKDPDTVTGEQVVSEGLLQLSYQDTLNHRGLCDFDWSKDMMLSVNDPRKTILDPYKNLSCGIRILARQIRSKHAIAIGKGAYWSVIKSDSSHEKISKIATITKEFSFCR